MPYFYFYTKYDFENIQEKKIKKKKNIIKLKIKNSFKCPNFRQKYRR